MRLPHRLTKLEAIERSVLVEEVEAQEARLRDRMTAAQAFAVMTCLRLGDSQTRNLTAAELRKLLKQRRQAASLPELRDKVEALQWAHQQFDEYERYAREMGTST
jgi:hypothetical protein